MSLLVPNYPVGVRVRVTTRWPHNGVGVVRGSQVLVPDCVRSGVSPPPGWVWVTYRVVLDDGYTFAGIPEGDLQPA